MEFILSLTSVLLCHKVQTESCKIILYKYLGLVIFGSVNLYRKMPINIYSCVRDWIPVDSKPQAVPEQKIPSALLWNSSPWNNLRLSWGNRPGCAVRITRAWLGAGCAQLAQSWHRGSAKARNEVQTELLLFTALLTPWHLSAELKPRGSTIRFTILSKKNSLSYQLP